MPSRWAAKSEQELAQWSAEENESRIVFSRLEAWKGFFRHAPECGVCRQRNARRLPGLGDIRVTPVGNLCLRCWLDWKACGFCGVEPAMLIDRDYARPLVFRGKPICVGCLVPDIPSVWGDWFTDFMATPKSSYQMVFEAYPLECW